MREEVIVFLVDFCNNVVNRINKLDSLHHVNQGLQLMQLTVDRFGKSAFENKIPLGGRAVPGQIQDEEGALRAGVEIHGPGNPVCAGASGRNEPGPGAVEGRTRTGW